LLQLNPNRNSVWPNKYDSKRNIYVQFYEYKFSFNGQERDDEVSGVGNTMTAEFWEYDGRLGRRWNLDPLFENWESPYVVFHSNPIYFNDRNGAKPIPTGLYNFFGRIGTAIGNIFSSHKKVWKNHEPGSKSSDHTKLSGFLTSAINLLKGHHYSSIPAGDWDNDRNYTPISLNSLTTSSPNHLKYEFNTNASEVVKNHKMRMTYDRNSLTNLTFGVISSDNWPVLTNIPSSFLPFPSFSDPLTKTYGEAGLTGVGQVLAQTTYLILGFVQPIGPIPLGPLVSALGIYRLTSIVNPGARQRHYFQLDIYATDPNNITGLNVEVKYKSFSRYNNTTNQRPFWHKWVYGVDGGGR
jgi:hypothetical protein